MDNILVLGAGKIGTMITELLQTTQDYRITVIDRDTAHLKQIPTHHWITTRALDITDHVALADAMADQFAVLNALPYRFTSRIAEAAKHCAVHYLDLTEDVCSTRHVKALAQDAQTAFIPQCGLAPGFISIVAYDLTRSFDELDSVELRVGALPKYPSNALKYNLTWSTDGLINEYLNPCEAIVQGELREVPPLEELQSFSLDGVNYEAFNTSGGLGTLCETLLDKVKQLNYRTVRYPGHRDIIKLLVQDLRLGERRQLLKEILENALPITMQDVVLIFANVSGYQNGRLLQESYANKLYSRIIGERRWSAIQIATASGICTMLDLLRDRKLPQQGFVRQEDAQLADFLHNRFGSYYDPASRTPCDEQLAA